jgi:penicillin-binding protein 2
MGEVPESDRWLENTIINREILPYVYTRNLPARQNESENEEEMQ